MNEHGVDMRPSYRLINMVVAKDLCAFQKAETQRGII